MFYTALFNLPLVSREWKNGSNSSYNCTPFLHSLLTKGKLRAGGGWVLPSPVFSLPDSAQLPGFRRGNAEVLALFHQVVQGDWAR